MKRKATVILVVLLAVLAAGGAVLNQQPIVVLEQTFRDLPIDARQHTGPLFWLHGSESKEQLEGELMRVLESGNGTFTAESRPHSDWLGPGWWRHGATPGSRASAPGRRLAPPPSPTR